MFWAYRLDGYNPLPIGNKGIKRLSGSFGYSFNAFGVIRGCFAPKFQEIPFCGSGDGMENVPHRLARILTSRVSDGLVW
jgi:hypothetical protein